jgi:hypothetical protein
MSKWVLRGHPESGPLKHADQRGFACEICNAHGLCAGVFALVIKGFTARIEVTY